MFYSDDPVWDAEMHAQAQERKLSEMQLSDGCGERIQTEYLYKLDGNTYCEKCIEDSKEAVFV